MRKGFRTFSHSLSDAIYGLLFVFGVVTQFNEILYGDIGFKDIGGNLKIFIFLVSIMVFLIIARIYIVLHGFDEEGSKIKALLRKRNASYRFLEKVIRCLILLSTLWMIKHFILEKTVMDCAEFLLKWISSIFFYIKESLINTPIADELIFKECHTVIVDHVITSSATPECKAFYYLKSEGAAVFFIALFLIAWDICIVVIPALCQKNIYAEAKYISKKRIPTKVFCYFWQKNLIVKSTAFFILYLVSEKGAGRFWMACVGFVFFHLDKFSIAYALPATILLFFAYFNNAKNTTDITLSQYFALLFSVIIYCFEPFGHHLKSALENCGLVKRRIADTSPAIASSGVSKDG